MKFSIVTGSSNMEPWIAKTIESIISQEGDFEIEYILMDGASKDKTVAIFEEYRRRVESGEWPVRCNRIVMSSFSEKDEGVFDATNKGFTRVTGDLLTWADGDNTFEPGAFEAIAKTFKAFPETQWVTAVGDTINDRWEKTKYGVCQQYRKDWLRLGVYGRETYFVEQNGCFWRKELWEKVKPIPINFKVAGDYWLWMQMAKYAAPLSLNVHISNFMRREGQLHLDGRYQKEQESIRPGRPLGVWIPRLFFWPYYHLPESYRSVFIWIYPILFPFYPREYVEIENDIPKKHTMPSFVVR